MNYENQWPELFDPKTVINALHKEAELSSNSREKAALFYHMGTIEGVSAKSDKTVDIPAEESPWLKAEQSYRKGVSADPGFKPNRSVLLQMVHEDKISPQAREETLLYLEGLIPPRERRNLRILRVDALLAEGKSKEGEEILQDILLTGGHSRDVLARLELLGRQTEDCSLLAEMQELLIERSSDWKFGTAIAVESALMLEMEKSDFQTSSRLYQKVFESSESYMVLSAARRTMKVTENWRVLTRVLEEESTLSQQSRQISFPLFESARVMAFAIGRFPTAIAILEKSLRYCDVWSVREFLCGLLRGVSDEDRTLHLRKLSEMAVGPTQKSFALWQLSRLLHGQRRLEVLREAVSADPENMLVNLELDQCLLTKGSESTNAQLLEQKARQSTNKNTTLWIRAVNYYSKQGDLKKTEELLSEALSSVVEKRIGPWSLHYRMAHLLAEQNRKKELLDFNQKVLGQLEDDQSRKTLSRTIANLAYSSDPTSSLALNIFGQILESSMGSGLEFLKVQDILRRIGDIQNQISFKEKEYEYVLERDRDHALAILWECGQIVLVEQRDEAKALSFFAQSLSLDPNYLPSLIASGRLHLQYENFSALAEMMERDLEHNHNSEPASELALRLALLLQYELKDTTRALDYYQKILEVQPLSLTPLLERRELLSQTDQWGELVGVMEALAFREKDNVVKSVILCRLGFLFEMVFYDFQSSEHYYQEALKSNPALEAARLAYERSLVRSGKWEHLSQWWFELQQTANEPADRVTILENLYLIAEPANAQNMLDLLLEAAPGHNVALLRLFRDTCERSDQQALAAVCKRLSRSIKGKKLSSSFLKLAILEGTPQSPSFVKDLWSLLKIDPADEGALLKIEAYLFPNMAPHEQAELLAMRVRAATTGPEKVSYLTQLGWRLSKAGEVKNAQRAFETALKKIPSHLPALKGLKFLFEQQGRWRELASIYEREGGEIFDSELAIEDLLRAGELYRKQIGDVPGAIRAYLGVFELDPFNETAFFNLKELYSGSRDYEGLFHLLSKRVDVLEEVKDKKDLLCLMAEIAYTRLKNPELAIEVYYRLLKIDPNHQRSYRILADLFMELKQPSKAAEALQGVLQITSDSNLLARTCLQLAELWEKRLGEPSKAIEAYEKALQYDSKNKVVKQKLAELYFAAEEWKKSWTAYKELLSLEKRASARKELYLKLAEVGVKLSEPNDLIEQSLFSALRYDPWDMRIVGAALKHFAKSGETEKRRSFTQRMSKDLCSEFLKNSSEPRSLRNLFQLMQWEGRRNSTFLLSSILRELRQQTEDSEVIYKKYANENMRPMNLNPLSEASVLGLFPPKILELFITFLRTIGPYLVKIHKMDKKHSNISRKTRIQKWIGPDWIQVLFNLPGLFSVESFEFHYINSSLYHQEVLPVLPTSVVVTGNEPSNKIFKMLNFSLARSLAALRMGLGFLTCLDYEEITRSIFTIFSILIPGYRAASISSERVESLNKVLPKKIREPLVPTALELSGKLSDKAMFEQLQILQLTFNRLGLLFVFDPSAAFQFVKDKKNKKFVFDRDAALQDLVVFCLSDRFRQLRKEIGIAL